MLQIAVGKKFGRLKVVTERKVGKKRFCECLCECGTVITIWKGHLASGHTQSCGCLKIELAKSRLTIHGMTGTRFYRTWANMKNRCTNTTTPDYHYYGRRGITICQAWVDDFKAFRDDMLASYEQHVNKFGEGDTTLDRVDNEGNYSPKNCRWATRLVQANNSRLQPSQQWFKATRLSDGCIKLSNNQNKFAKDHDMGQRAISSILHHRQGAVTCKGWTFHFIPAPIKKLGAFNRYPSCPG